MTIEQTWNNGGYLSGLKGVTIPNNTPSFNEDPRKGRHWSSDNAIQADDESLKGIFASLNSMPTVSQQDVQIPDPQPVSQSQPSEQSVAQQQTTQAIHLVCSALLSELRIRAVFRHLYHELSRVRVVNLNIFDVVTLRIFYRIAHRITV